MSRTDHTDRTLTVRELRQVLFEEPDQDALVVFASDYRDVVHTQQAHFLDGELSAATLHPSAYSESGWAVNEDQDADDNNEDEGPKILLLS